MEPGPGIEPGPDPYQGPVLPLNYPGRDFINYTTREVKALALFFQSRF